MDVEHFAASLMRSLYSSYAARTPKQNKITLFSRQGKKVSLDFALLAEELRRRIPDAEVCVCTTDPESVDLRAFASSLFSMTREVASSRVCIVDGYIPSVSIPNLDAQTRVIQIWHALGAIKKFGRQSLDTAAGRPSQSADTFNMHGNYDWIVAAGPGAISAYSQAFGYNPGRIVPLGMPRMDYLLDPSPHSRFKRTVQHLLDDNPVLSQAGSCIVYAPTLRRERDRRGWMTEAVKNLAEAFAPFDCRLIVAGHPLDSGWNHDLARTYGNVTFIENAASRDLIGLADYVISDYSAISFEAALLGKPTLFYVPDIAQYRQSPGLNVDPCREFPASSFTDAAELARAIMMGHGGEAQDFARFSRRYFQGVGYGATERIAGLVEHAYRETFATAGEGAPEAGAAEGSRQGAIVADRPAQPKPSWAFSVYRALEPLFQGRVFAFGDTCVGAVYYQGYFPGMQELSLAALREDFDKLRAPVVQLAREAGWVVRGAEDADQAYLALYPAPNEKTDPRALLCLYPLDNVPHQSTLRFKLLAESSRVRSGDIPAIEHLKRYRDMDTGTVARLFGGGRASGVMGERTIQQRTIALDALFPLRSVPFEDGSIELPRDISCWASEPTPNRKEITRIIQHDGVESLEELKRISPEVGFDFFLVGGSLLGALRHEGYIPWDDDLDVGMLRADYRAFVEHGQEALGDDYFIQLPATDEHIHFVYARLRHKGIDYLTLYNEGKDFDKSLWIDVFPFDAIPSNPTLARIQQLAARTFARVSMGLKRRREYAIEDLRDPAPLTRTDAGYLRAYAILSRYFPIELFDRLYHAAAECFNPVLAGKSGTRYGSFIPTYTTIEAGEADSLCWVPFEEHDMPVLRGSESFLERQYGEFRRMPPVHERQTDHGFLRLELPDGTSLEAYPRA